MKLNHADWPGLKQYWDSYGHRIPFEQLDGIKTRSDRCYVVVRWVEDGSVYVADLARAGADHEWDMSNDAHDALTEQEWRKLRIVPDCDWFEIPE